MDAVRMPRHQRRMRVVIDGIGVVDIDRGLFKDGEPRVRVDVVSDFDRYGPAPDGLHYQVENGDPGPGVVFVTGRRQPSVDPDVAEAHAEGEHAFCLPGCQTGRKVSRETEPDVCDDGCGKHVDHKVNGDPECGPR